MQIIKWHTVYNFYTALSIPEMVSVGQKKAGFHGDKPTLGNCILLVFYLALGLAAGAGDLSVTLPVPLASLACGFRTRKFAVKI